MANKRKYIIILGIMAALVFVLFRLNDTASVEEQKVAEFFPEARKIQLVNDISDDVFISLNLPAVRRAYMVDDQMKAYVVSCIGYNGPVNVLAAMEDDRLIGIDILEHEETLDYAQHIESDWFLERFADHGTSRYLNLVVLDKENPEDIVQVTGATVSSQAVVNAVNAAIGAYQYQVNGMEMGRVPDVVPQEMWQKDANSFAINWKDGSIRINTETIKEYEQVEMDVTLINTTGTETDFRVKGPTLRTVLQKEGLDLSDYEGIGISGRDGYYTMVDREKLEVGEVILAWEANGELLPEDEKPVRTVLPLELGPIWVKMVTNIDLYDEITPKDIDKVHMFNPLIEGIEPYLYEYYGSRDKSVEIGKILAKFDQVDTKGFFTMTATDGLTKNETISLVRQRYFIKYEGENAPMNIAPNFKLGMNVKHMTHFSTTRDAVVFPEKMVQVVRTRDIEGREALLLEDVLLTAGMRWKDWVDLRVIDAGENHVTELSHEDMIDSWLVQVDGRTQLYTGDRLVTDDLLRVEKDEN